MPPGGAPLAQAQPACHLETHALRFQDRFPPASSCASVFLLELRQRELAGWPVRTPRPLASVLVPGHWLCGSSQEEAGQRFCTPGPRPAPTPLGPHVPSGICYHRKNALGQATDQPGQLTLGCLSRMAPALPDMQRTGMCLGSCHLIHSCG